jgi:hypothetical protein
MTYDTSGINISQTFSGELLAFGFKRNPGNQSLFDDPPLGAVKACSELVNLLGKFLGNMGSDNTSTHTTPLHQFKSILIYMINID